MCVCSAQYLYVVKAAPLWSHFAMLYLTRAALFFQVGETGRVIGIDHIKELVDWSIANVQKDHGYLLESGQVKLVSEYTKNNGFNVKSL